MKYLLDEKEMKPLRSAQEVCDELIRKGMVSIVNGVYQLREEVFTEQTAPELMVALEKKKSEEMVMRMWFLLEEFKGKIVYLVFDAVLSRMRNFKRDVDEMKTASGSIEVKEWRNRDMAVLGKWYENALQRYQESIDNAMHAAQHLIAVYRKACTMGNFTRSIPENDPGTLKFNEVMPMIIADLDNNVLFEKDDMIRSKGGYSVCGDLAIADYLRGRQVRSVDEYLGRRRRGVV